MPVTFEIQPAGSDYDFHSKFSGSITPEDIARYFLSITDVFPSWDGKRALVEFLPEARLNGFNFAAISALSRTTSRYQEQLGTACTAFVAPNAVVYGFARMYKAIRNPPYLINIFRSREPAILWLRSQAG